MKTIAIIAASLIMLSASFSNANTPKTTMTFIDSFGRMFCMPVKVEEAVEEFPFDQTEWINSDSKKASSTVFDISNLSKPEIEEEIPAELEALFSK